ncbi:MAG: T9SS type A sorting domain-containing protein [Ginsengibacter sp.]
MSLKFTVILKHFHVPLLILFLVLILISGKAQADSKTTDYSEFIAFDHSEVNDSPQIAFFNVYIDKDQVSRLEWSIANEDVTDYVEVEKSLDGKLFKTIALVFGPETIAKGGNNYRFSDKNNQKTHQRVNYYRLKLIGQTGTFKYSSVESTDYFETTNTALELFPVPFKDNLRIEFSCKKNDRGQIRVTSSRGELVKKEDVELHDGDNTLTLNNLSLFGPGLYIIDVLAAGKPVSAGKIIKQ